LDDLLLPFSDLGYKVTNHTSYGGGIGIIGDFNNSIVYSELKDDLIRVLDYIKKSSNGKLGYEVNIKITTDEINSSSYQAIHGGDYRYSFKDVIDNNIFIKDDDKIMIIGIGI
jgi:hypothetical protein